MEMAEIEIKYGNAVLIYPDGSGDTRLTWDRSKPDEVENAEKNFKRLKKLGFTAWSVKADGSKKEIIQEFDKGLDKIIMMAPVSGG